MKNRPPLYCPLCLGADILSFQLVFDREYFHCSTCDLVFLHPSFYLSREQEFERYEQHRNNPKDPGYITFLGQLIRPLLGFLSPGAQGMDFGSGPVPAISHLLREARYEVASYDIFYADDPKVLNRTYDFVTASEVAEHLHSARDALDRIWSLILPGGIFGIMTGIRPRDVAFADWYYIRDPTHVIFFSNSTMEWLCQHWSASIIYFKDNVVLFRKRGNTDE